ncbi:DUF1566 domain-containing protein [Desulfoplanes formicivorans]|uniref:Lcl C-terminal domain-containing protein n=1 Tax=Desulfoplanes formicivorans TaxID=1592317 RepID=A0A194AK85_9BACT|nr:DUF1566 domain-containing protein [Desulfoplanes formicivorans]GAU09471.1 hypothetical protein DPF_2197 [Desulfoplanes formicivorans]
MPHVLWTGQQLCYDASGRPIDCQGSGQDAATRGSHTFSNRFMPEGNGLVRDQATGLIWTQTANFGQFPMTWQDALNLVRTMNRDGYAHHRDWRLPNRRELRSLISYGNKNPALPASHPFEEVFLGWYWSSTTAAIAPDHAWYVHLEGGRMFYGKKDQFALTWPVCGQSINLPKTGQTLCHDSAGRNIPCTDSGQDGALRQGLPWPHPRFTLQGDVVHDNLTGLVWLRNARAFPKTMTWEQALASVAGLTTAGRSWRLPTINELESLVDASTFSPALPAHHPFLSVQQAYWSSTSSFFEPDWAHVLYLHKGAVGVGWKPKPEFHVWPVSC